MCLRIFLYVAISLVVFACCDTYDRPVDYRASVHIITAWNHQLVLIEKDDNIQILSPDMPRLLADLKEEPDSHSLAIVKLNGHLYYKPTSMAISPKSIRFVYSGIHSTTIFFANGEMEEFK